jgi:2-polyprenyl-3-methyl-5-hydroxy-6-metoxy-1,4-benzoquinol methylase
VDSRVAFWIAGTIHLDHPSSTIRQSANLGAKQAWAEAIKMAVAKPVDLEGIKVRVKATWMAGDYGRIAQFTEATASDFIARRHIKPGMQVLDVACGTGNLCVPAAKTGAIVTGVDIATNLLDQARSRAALERVDIKFEEGDAEQLSHETGAFDLVVSMFGAMFAPRPDLVASELSRVCRPGGQIAMANWTPTGFIGSLLAVTSKYVSAPVGMPSPLLWGDEETVRARLCEHVTDLEVTRTMASLQFPFSIADTVEFYRVHYGPTLRAFAGLIEETQSQLRRDLENLYRQHNIARDGTTHIDAEYLEVVATRK